MASYLSEPTHAASQGDQMRSSWELRFLGDVGEVEKKEKTRLVQVLVEFTFQSWMQKQLTFRGHTKQTDSGIHWRSQKLLQEQSVL